MRQVRHEYLPLAICAVAAVLFSQKVTGQGVPTPPPSAFRALMPVPILQDQPEILPAPEWSAWRAFYSQVVLAPSSSPEENKAFVADRTGLTQDATDALAVAGSQYLQELSAIDERARKEIVDRFGPSSLPFNPPSLLPNGQSGIRPIIQAPQGKTVEEVLEAEGFVARIDEEKQSLLKAHLDQLAISIGSASVDSLKRYVATEVAPNVKRVRHVGHASIALVNPVPPAPATSPDSTKSR